MENFKFEEVETIDIPGINTSTIVGVSVSVATMVGTSIVIVT